MCPEKERYVREMQKGLSSYECDQQGQIVHERTVKDYSRSAADQDKPLPHELRPVPVLQTTMHYLIDNVWSHYGIPRPSEKLCYLTGRQWDTEQFGRRARQLV